MRILIAEDNELTRLMLAETLKKAGYEVDVARDGREALSRIRDGGVRLVISDWEMPHMSGADLCRAVRNESLAAYVYIILLTSHNSPAERVQGLSAGADDFVAKPFDPAELIARVRSGERVLALETRDVAIFAMAKLAESRDPETGAHLERVRNYSRIISLALASEGSYRDQITPEFIGLIYLTSPLHDIGKVGIPDSVLLKPGRLNDREFEIMKTHTTIGAQTLDAALRQFPSAAFLRMARDIAAGHHEWFDGTGYPAGLAGTNIPLAARIVALADVYDALTSKRVYKQAFAHETAKSIIANETGTHFDPETVRAFERSEAEFIRILGRHQEGLAEAA